MKITITGPMRRMGITDGEGRFITAVLRPAKRAIMHLTNKPGYATKGPRSEPYNVHKSHKPDFQ